MLLSFEKSTSSCCSVCETVKRTFFIEVDGNMHKKTEKKQKKNSSSSSWIILNLMIYLKMYYTPAIDHMHHILALALWTNTTYWPNKYPMLSITSQFDIPALLWSPLNKHFGFPKQAFVTQKQKKQLYGCLHVLAIHPPQHKLNSCKDTRQWKTSVKWLEWRWFEVVLLLCACMKGGKI